jgi:hypothetical protein
MRVGLRSDSFVSIRLVPLSIISAVYGLGFVGAIVYYVQHAVTFGAGLLGVLKAIVWRAMLVYKLLELLKM